jgi:PAS domain S-box-containing protein
MTENSLNICGLKEAELRAELLRYRELFEYAPIGIVQTTVDGKILKANPAMVGMLGYDPLDDDSEGIGNIVEKLYAQPEKRQQLLDLALDREELFNHETQFCRKDGVIITCRLHLRVVRGEDGQVRFLESFIEDITDRKKTAVALLESEKLYRGIFENTGAGTIIIERDMTISFANTGFQKMTGYCKDEIEGRMKWTILIADPVELDMMMNYHLRRRNKQHDTPIEYEFVLLDRSGNRKIFFSASIS